MSSLKNERAHQLGARLRPAVDNVNARKSLHRTEPDLVAVHDRGGYDVGPVPHRGRHKLRTGNDLG
jgi:hypothetical protein